MLNILKQNGTNVANRLSLFIGSGRKFLYRRRTVLLTNMSDQAPNLPLLLLTYLAVKVIA